MTTSQTNLRIVEEFSRLKALADRSDKIDRERVYGRVTFANFDAIVRCVNSHDDLLAALKGFMALDESFDRACDTALKELVDEGQRLAPVVQAARAAIKKAEGL